jgi:hypothetical protein
MPTNKIKTHVKNIHISVFCCQNSQKGPQNAKGVKVGGQNQVIKTSGTKIEQLVNREAKTAF